MHLGEIWLKSSFVNHHNTPPSIFRQLPSKDVDAAWESIHQKARNFLITADEVRRLGKDPDFTVMAPEEWRTYDPFLPQQRLPQSSDLTLLHLKLLDIAY